MKASVSRAGVIPTVEAEGDVLEVGRRLIAARAVWKAARERQPRDPDEVSRTGIALNAVEHEFISLVVPSRTIWLVDGERLWVVWSLTRFVPLYVKILGPKEEAH